MNEGVQHRHTDKFLTSFNSKQRLSGAVVLDSGCGDAYASIQFARYGAKHITAHDPFAPLGVSTDKITFVKSYIPFAETFDIVWTHHVIEHVPNPIQYLTNLRLILKQDGELWLGCPNTAYNSVFALGHLHNFTLGNMILCLQRAEFGVTDIRWLVDKGQIRIRIPVNGVLNFPTPFQKLYVRNKHFDVTKLPERWRW